MTDNPQRTLGKYQIRGELGKGAMGVVYRGWDPSLEREVALKVMASAIVSDEELKERFEREARAVARLQHPNIVTVYDLGYDDQEAPFIAMELLRGEDLEHRIRRNPLTLKEKLGVMEQVCRGLAVAHKKGIVHRDIKPANVFITESGEVKIMDFGVARWQKSSHTQTGAVLGTADYMSPEQIRGTRVDGRSDIFSAGVILYRLLTNKKPFSGENIQAVFFKVLNQEPPTIVLPEGNDMPELQAIVDKALAKSSEDRYTEASDLADDLRDLMNLYHEVLGDDTVFETIYDPSGPEDGERGSEASRRPTGSSERIFGPTSASPGSAPRTHGPSGAHPSPTAPPPGARGGTGTRSGRTALGRSVAPTRRGAAVRPAGARLEPGTRGASVGVPLEPSLGYGKIAAGVALVALLAGGGYWWWSPGTAPSEPTAAVGAATDIAGRFARAEDAFEKGLYSLASNEVEDILLDDPDNARAIELKGRIEEALSEPVASGEDATTQPETSSDGAGASTASTENAGTDPNLTLAADLAADASIAIADGDLSRAERLIGEGRDLDPGNRRWGQLAQQLSRARDAAARAQQARERQAAVDDYVVEASEHLRNKEYDAAIRAYDEALALDPANSHVVMLKSTAMTSAELERREAAAAAATLEFTESDTEYIAPEGGDDSPSGFETGGVSVKRATQAAENPAELLVQIVPRTVSPGDPYFIRVRVHNQGNRPIGLKSLELVSTYGNRTTGRGQSLDPRVAQVNPQETSVIFEARDTWTEERNRGSIEAIVTLVGDARLRKMIQWQ